MKLDKLLVINPHLFDGGAAAAAAGGTASSAATGNGAAQPSSEPASAPATPNSSRRNKGNSMSNVVYGKQKSAAAEPAPTGTSEAGAATPNNQEALRQEYRDLMNGKFKDIHTEETQRMINHRFGEERVLQDRIGKMQSVIDLVAQRYGVEDGDLTKIASALDSDDRLLREQAEEAGMSVDQFKEFQRLQRENKALQAAQKNEIERQIQNQRAQKWYNEAMQLKAQFPDFDLAAELKDRNFLSALQAGTPMELVYKGKYFDRFMSDAAQNAAAQAQKATVENIRAKGQRPAENGTASQSSFIVKDDVSKLTKKDRAEIARRALEKGEHIEF